MTPTPPAPPVVAMRGASVGYGDRPAVRGVDLRIDAGEVVALVGPNGSGKTTLVRGLLGLATVTAGEVELFGVPAARFRERYRIGYVPQRHTVGGASPSTVEEVVSSGRLPRKRRPSRVSASDRAAVAAAIEAVDLTERRKAAVSTLSGGQQRRTLIARALAAEPEVLVMDEPTAGVDAENRDRLVGTLAELVGRGLTLLIVTHEVTPLLPVLTRVVALDHGRLVHDGPADVPAAWAPGGLPVADGGPVGLADGDGLGHDHDAGHDEAHRAPRPVGRSGRRGPLPTTDWPAGPGGER
jgi:zinc transport system ATP-binding protein